MVSKATALSSASPAVVLTVLLFQMLAAAPAAGDEAHLVWNGCGSDGAPAVSFACDINSGEHTLFTSFVLDQAVSFSSWGLEAIFTIGTAGTSPTLPNWWRFGADSCRAGAFRTSYDLPDISACVDPWAGSAIALAPTFEVITTPDQPPHGSITFERVRVAAASAQPVTFAAGTEYLGLQVHLRHDRTVGAGSCTGCCLPVWITLVQLTVAGDSGTRFLPGQPIATWQQDETICLPTGARNATWGSIRALYR